jgi:hypothetical protein
VTCDKSDDWHVTRLQSHPDLLSLSLVGCYLDAHAMQGGSTAAAAAAAAASHVSGHVRVFCRNAKLDI